MSAVRRLLSAAVGMAVMGGGCRMAPAPASPLPAAEQVRRQHLAQLDSLESAVLAFDNALRSNAPHDVVRAAFATARMQYKHVEALVEFYLPTTADLINGPALDDMAEDDPDRVLPPEGFQVIEELVFDSTALADADERAMARTQARILAANVRRVRDDALHTPLTDAAVFDAARLQLVRLMSLGLAGFDSPVAQQSLPEARAALDGLEAMLRPYAAALTAADGAVAERLAAQLDNARAALDAETDFESFDRLQFLTAHFRPLSATLLGAQLALHVPMPPDRRAWRMTIASPFEAEAYDPAFFAPGMTLETSQHEVELGRTMFADPRLSRTGERSCQTCHEPSRAFTDGKARSLPGRGASPAFRRNAPTLVNSTLQNAQFADLRAPFLEDQVADVLANAEEMHESLDGVVRALTAQSHYRDAFARVYGTGSTITPRTVQTALAAYLRTLNALDAPFDRYVRGDTAALSPDARRGFTVFMGKGKCGTCHFAPLFNGSVPPHYQKTESEVLGVPVAPRWQNATIDADSGRARVTRLAIHLHAFKTPTLRNVALTAPYMHNGVYRTLDEVIEFYDRGGGVGIGAHVDNQTLPPDPLRLTTAEKRELVAFLHALTDTTTLAPSPRY